MPNSVIRTVISRIQVSHLCIFTSCILLIATTTFVIVANHPKNQNKAAHVAKYSSNQTKIESPTFNDEGDGTKSNDPQKKNDEGHDAMSIASKEDVNCIGDRLAHEKALNRGDFICATHGRYRIGLDKNGDFIWRDDELEETKRMASGGDHFVLTSKGVFVLYNDAEGDSIAWSVDSGEDIKPEQYCLTGYPCPYLHLHNGGVCVMNWIDSNGDWIEKRIQSVFDLKWDSITVNEDSENEPDKTDTKDINNNNKIEHNCLGDRMPNEVDFHRGDFICSKNDEAYELGLNHNGHFIYKDTENGITKKLLLKGAGKRFVLKKNATLVMFGSDDEIIWSMEAREQIHFSPKCIPEYDCPYLHLHTSGGVVINWTDKQGWHQRKIQKVFDLNW